MSKAHILVVDDDKDIVRILRGYLEDAGFGVAVAYDGATAIHTLRREPPDLLLLDIMLPGQDGWTIIRFVRATPAIATLPIMLVTARVDENDAAHLAVQDSGAGIEPTHLAHLFTRFYRTDQARSRDTGGSGLGLAIAKALVETQGGQIAAHSDGLGATFIIRLPLQPTH